MIKINNPNINNIAKEYTEILLDKFKKKKYSNSDLQELKELLLSSPQNLYAKSKSYSGKIIISDKDYYSKIIRSEYNINGDKKNLAYWLIEKLGIIVCPYCNHNYIFSRSKDKGRCQLDHFYPKSNYPNLSLSFYNLIPVCPTCNLLKKDAVWDITLHPYIKGINTEPIFQLLDLIEFSLKIKEEDKESIGIINLNKLQQDLKIVELYQQHTSYVKDLLYKAEAYTDGYCETLITSFSDMGLSEKDIKRLIFGNNINPEDFNKYPLSKFTYDILRQLNLIF